MILLFDNAGATRTLTIFTGLVVVAAISFMLLGIYTLRHWSATRNWFAFINIAVFFTYFFLLSPFSADGADGAAPKAFTVIFLVVQSFLALMIAIVIKAFSKPKVN